MFELASVSAGLGLIVLGMEDALARRDLALLSAISGSRAIALTAVGLIAAGALVLGTACAPSDSVLTHALALTVALAVLMVRLVRFRSSDGADRMLAVALLAAAAGALLPMAPALAVPWSITVLLILGLAYVDSAVVKLRAPGWRSGRTLALILNTPSTGRPRLARLVLDVPALAATASWAVMVLEFVAAPALFAGGAIGAVVAACLWIMHLWIAVLMRLNRFLWSFGAALALAVAAGSLLHS